jgi:DNA-binding GntR family transcriptional regulator
MRYNEVMNSSPGAAAKKEPQSLSAEQVCERIRASILQGHLQPGEKLVEQDLAAEFNVSRTPVREAIRQLEVEKLVSRTPFVGVTVTRLTPKEVLELLDIREVLEGLTARLAALHAGEEQRTRLRAILKKLSAAATAGSVNSYLDHALSFRRTLVECAGSDTLAEYVLGIENRLRLMGNRTAIIPGRMQAAIAEHEKLLQALESGDSMGAERLNRERIQHIRADVAKALSFSVF